MYVPVSLRYAWGSSFTVWRTAFSCSTEHFYLCRILEFMQEIVAHAFYNEPRSNLLVPISAVAKALKANGIPCPDSRDAGAQRLASYLGIPLQPPPPFDVTTPTTPADTGPPSIESKDKGPETALPNDRSILPQAPPLPSMTSAERHVWHFCTSCAARVCNACGYRDNVSSKRWVAEGLRQDRLSVCNHHCRRQSPSFISRSCL